MSVPTNLIPTKITGLPEYTGSSQAGYLPYVLEGSTYKVQFSTIASAGEVPPSRTLTAGTGLTGGGDLSADRVFAIAAGGVGADQLDTTGVVAGVYGDGSNVPTVTVDANGRVTSVTTSPVVAAGYVPVTRTITAGTGLLGGGSLASDVTLSLNLASATPQALGTATAGVSTAAAREDHVHPAVDLSDTNETQGALPLGRGGTGDALSPVAGAVVYSTGTKFALTNPGIAGQVLISTGTDEPVWSNAGAGTVISVGVSGGTTGFTFSDSPVTFSGTMTMSGTLNVANGGTGATDAATARTNLGAAASGANSDITSLSGITGEISTPSHIQFDPAATALPDTAQIGWNADDGTLDVGLFNGSVLQVGQEQMFYAKNTSGATIPDGTPVMFTGTVGASGKLTFGLAVADGSVPSEYMMGVTTQEIANNDFGYVTTFGLVRGIDTTGTPYGQVWAEGDLLYFDPATPGGWTNVQPVAPNIHVPVAVVVSAGPGGSGSIFVRMLLSQRLNRLQDVRINGTGTPLAGQTLIYDATQQRWENHTLTAGANVTITNGDGSITIASSDQFTGTVTSVAASVPTGFTVSGSPITTSGTLAVGFAPGYSLPTDASQANWDTAFSDRLKWDGGATDLDASLGRTSLGLGTAAVLNAGVANGVATLDGGGTVPTSQLPAAVLGAVKYQGTWNASTNTPTLASGVGVQGYYYVVDVAGSTNLDGITDWLVGDWAIFNGTIWEKIDNTDAVSSVNGLTGTVVLDYADVGAPSTTGVGATGTWAIDITGNAATVTNGVYTTGSYADPTWITSLSGSKITGDISGNAANVTGVVAVANGGTGQTSYTDGQLLIGNSTGNTLSKATLTAGTNINITNGPGSITISATGGTGTVTSVDVSGGTTGLTTSGGPVTSSGTITLGGTLGVANGGTGATSLTSGYVLKGNGTSAVSASVIYDDGTNAGVGTTTLTRAFNVASTSSLNTRLTRIGSTGGAGIEFENTLGTFAVFGTPTGASTGAFVPTGSGVDLGATSNQWGNIYAATSVRAPIFYDSNDTGRYLDPAGTSLLGAAYFNNVSLDPSNIGAGVAVGTITEGSTGFSAPGIAFGTGTGQHGAVVYAGGIMYFGAENGSDNTLGVKATLDNTGVFTADGDVRAPIFYDSNNTSYYVDPASTSSMGTIQGSQYSVGFTNPFDAVNASPWYGLGRSNVDGGTPSNTMVQLAGFYGLRLRSQSYILDLQGSSGIPFSFNDYGQFAGSVRAPIFYDSNNTGYYLDPTGTSQLLTVQTSGDGFRSFGTPSAGIVSQIYFANTTNTRAWNWQLDENNDAALWNYNGSAWGKRVTVTSGSEIFLRNSFGNDISLAYPSVFGYSSSYRTTVIGNQAYNTVCIGVSPASNPSGSFNGNGEGREVMFRNGVNFITPNSANNGYHLPLNMTDGYVTSSGSFRAPIFYDSDNTAYFVNPASGSTLAGQLNQYGYLNIAYGGSAYAGMGISNTFASASVFATSFIDFLNESQTQKASIFGNFGTDGHGYLQFLSTAPGVARTTDSRTTTAYAYYNQWNFQTSAGIAANIYYDRDNTAYYVDPASTSVFGGLTMNGTLQMNSGLIIGRPTIGSDVNNNNDTGSLSVRGDASNAASISFHRVNAYAINMGLGTDGVFRIGGWSASANALQMDGAGRLTMLTDVRAPIFYDSNNTAYYTNPAGSSYVSGDFQIQQSGINGLRVISGTGTQSLWVRAGYDTDGSPTPVSSPLNIQFQSSGSSGGSFTFVSGNTKALTITGDHAQGAGSLRAPIFYDSNNTAYYVNPNGNSIFNGSLTVNGGITGSVTGCTFSDDSANQDNITLRTDSGFFQSSTGTTAEGWPLDSNGWQHMISCTHSNDANYYAMQLAASFYEQGLFYRSTNGSGSTAWSRVALYGNNYAGNLYASIFYDSNNTAYRLDPAGSSAIRNICLGGGSTSAFDATIHIVGAQGGYDRLTQISPSSANKPGFNIMSARNGSNADLWWSWGVNTDNTWRINSGVGYNGSAGITLDASGNLTAGGNVTAYSDIRIKDNVEQISGALDRVSAIRGVTYTRNDLEDKERRYAGVIAQEIEQVLPEAVFDRDDRKAVDYNATIGLLIEAIKELKAEVEELKGK